LTTSEHVGCRRCGGQVRFEPAAVNGQTGKVGVEVPISRAARIFELILGILVAVFAATALILAILGISGIA
jgi:hypothetical protein